MTANTSAGNFLKVITTDDGSHSLFVENLNEHYHSKYGAIAESRHIFIGAGLHFISKPSGSYRILEIGFGTGLNAFLTFMEAKIMDLQIEYTGIEPFPLPESVFSKLNYPEQVDNYEDKALYLQLHECSWNSRNRISANFLLTKNQVTLQDYIPEPETFDLVYFDAFGPDVQPEMWTLQVFDKLAQGIKPGGVLVTYSTKGIVKRNLRDAGFSIEKLPGPKGKREILRATRFADINER